MAGGSSPGGGRLIKITLHGDVAAVIIHLVSQSFIWVRPLILTAQLSIPWTDESGQIRDLDRAPFSKGIALLFTVYNNNRANQE
jgi:hypothetical protein